MIIPTPDFDPLFAQDGIPFAEKMQVYIHREFGDLLQHHHLERLDNPRNTESQSHRAIYRVDPAHELPTPHSANHGIIQRKRKTDSLY